jgi:hypothetical protein
MDIAEAIEQARKAQSPEWSLAKLASIAGVSEATARRWQTRGTIPRGDQLMALRRELPGLAELLDGTVAA